MHNPYNLYKRGKIYYGYTLIKVNGIKKRKVFSTGQTSKLKANEFCQDLMKKGKLYESSEKTQDVRDRSYIFEYFAEDWWVWGKCPYIKERKRNGRELTQRFAQTNLAILNRYILPTFGKRDIREITHLEINEWKFEMVEEKGLAPKTANNNLSVLRTMTNFAWSHDIIEVDPCKKVRQMSTLGSKKRGILKKEEVAMLFKNRNNWVNDLGFLMNLIAATTGLRLGEIQALRQSDIKDGYILVQHSYDDKYGLKCTKTRNVRAVPTHREIISAMRVLDYGPGTYIFSLDNPKKPVNKHFPELHLYQALASIGINKEERKKRNITFHSWRHYLNTQLRTSGIADSITRQVTGHATEEMTDYYTHYSSDDLQAIIGISDKLFTVAKLTEDKSKELILN